MKRVLTLLLCVAMVLSVSACKKKEDKASTKTTAPSTTTTTEYYEKTYADNEAINNFFKEYLAKYNNLDTSTIRRAKAPSTSTTAEKELTEEELKKESEKLHKKYLAVIGECDVTVIVPDDTRYALRIEIEGGSTEKQRDRMLDVFCKIAMVMDPGCTESIMEIVTERLKSYTSTQLNVPVCGRVSLYSYTPIIAGYSSCRIVMLIADAGDTTPTVAH